MDSPKSVRMQFPSKVQFLRKGCQFSVRHLEEVPDLFETGKTLKEFSPPIGRVILDQVAERTASGRVIERKEDEEIRVRDQVISR